MMVGKNGKEAKDATEMKDLKDLAKQLDSFKRDIGAELRDLKESMDFCSNACDGVKGLTAEIAALRKEVKKLTKSNNSLEAENARLSLKVNEMEQYQRMNNLEIKGIPDESDPVEIIKQLGEVIGETIQEDDVDTCHWVPTAKQGERNIIVRFVRRSKRNAVLAKSRKKKVNSTDLGFQPGKPVFVNEHLTQQNKRLLGLAVQKKKEAQWKFVWTADCKIFARQQEKSAAIRIAVPADLEKIQSPVTQSSS